MIIFNLSVHFHEFVSLHYQELFSINIKFNAVSRRKSCGKTDLHIFHYILQIIALEYHRFY